MPLDPYAHSVFHGKPLDNASIAALQAMEVDLGYELTIAQGIGGAAASSGTHLEGRAVDLPPFDWRNKLRVGLKHGFIGWHRPMVPGLWPEHIHMILVLGSRTNSRGLAPAGFRQIASYLSGRDGLLSNARNSSNNPSGLVPFIYPPKVAPVPVFKNNVTEARDALVEAAHALSVAASKLSATPKSRSVVHAQAAGVQTLRRGVNGLLAVLPKR